MATQHIQLRFNTDKEKVSMDLPAWRVMVDGVEHLAHHVRVEVPMHTTEDRLPSGKLKWHLSCEGLVTWEDSDRTCVIR